METIISGNSSFKRQDNLEPHWQSWVTFYGRVNKTFGPALPKISPQSKILDFGCSIGHTTKELSEIYKGSFVIGVDIFEDRLREENGNLYYCNFAVTDGINMPFRQGTFDAIFAMNNILYSFKKYKNNPETIINLIELVRERGYLLLSSFETFIILRKNGKALNIMSTKYFIYKEILDLIKSIGYKIDPRNDINIMI